MTPLIPYSIARRRDGQLESLMSRARDLREKKPAACSMRKRG